MEEIPPLVASAQALARQVGFPLTREEAEPGRASASLNDTGRFLAMLAAGCGAGRSGAGGSGGGRIGVGGSGGGRIGVGRIGELGTGAGIGASWIASAMPADCVLVTAERDERLATAARELFAGDPRIEVITGDALEAMSSRGPFDLVFADSGVRDGRDFAKLVGLLRLGGRIVMDDVTPQRILPPDSPLRSQDPKRQLFGGEPRLVSVEVVLPDLRNSLLVGTRMR